MKRWTCIVPSNRPDEVVKFTKLWAELFEKHNVHLVMMWDLPEVPKDLNIFSYEATHLCHKDLTTKYIPTKTDMIRSFAFKWAYDNTDADYFLTLDDDVRPINNPHETECPRDIFKHYEMPFEGGDHLSEYFSVSGLTNTPMEIEMRGYPYKDRVVREVAVQYGGWEGVLDYDAATQLSNPQPYRRFSTNILAMPKGCAVTCCIMNCAWKRKFTPIMWQLPMLDGRYNRVGDIWSGLFIKKTLDAIGCVMIINGAASVKHERASNAYHSLVKEAPSVLMNDNLWDALGDHKEFYTQERADGSVDMVNSYQFVLCSAASFFERHDKEYAQHFLSAADEWLNLWNSTGKK